MKTFSLVLLSFMLATVSLQGLSAKKAGPEDTVKVKMETSMGDIVLELDRKRAPVTVKNFIKYVKKGHYNGTIFHRVIDSFMIQGGGMTKDLKEKTTDKPIKNEATNGLPNNKYTIAMARTNDINSATSQFFINVKDNDFLNHQGKHAMRYGYAVFGRVVEGQKVVDKIKRVKTTFKHPHENVPVEPVVIKKAMVLK